jgi:CRISPR-associated protein Csx10
MFEMVLTLQLRSPLALHQSRSNVQYVDSLDYLPGAALRGALAETYLAKHGAPDAAFEALFLSNQVHFGDLWPTLEAKTTTLLPATARACKRGKLSPGHQDSLVDVLLDSLAGKPAERRCRAAECGNSPVDRIGGYLCSLEPVQTVKPDTPLRVNTAIERGTGSVAREMLFSQRTLIGKQGKGDHEQKVLFSGRIRVRDSRLSDDLAGLLKEGARFSLGAGRSRGLGEVQVAGWQPVEPDGSLNERWQKFNAAAQRAGGAPDRRYFAITLQSHLILRDEVLRPILADIQPEHFGLPPGVQHTHAHHTDYPARFLSAVTVPGWNAALGLPKSDTIALARGSVWLFECDAAVEAAVLTQLVRIESEGIGERRSEGFGRVVACALFHYQQWQEVK